MMFLKQEGSKLIGSINLVLRSSFLVFVFALASFFNVLFSHGNQCVQFDFLFLNGISAVVDIKASFFVKCE